MPGSPRRNHLNFGDGAVAETLRARDEQNDRAKKHKEWEERREQALGQPISPRHHQYGVERVHNPITGDTELWNEPEPATSPVPGLRSEDLYREIYDYSIDPSFDHGYGLKDQHISPWVDGVARRHFEPDDQGLMRFGSLSLLGGFFARLSSCPHIQLQVIKYLAPGDLTRLDIMARRAHAIEEAKVADKGEKLLYNSPFMWPGILRNNNVVHHLLQDIFPGEQFVTVRHLMRNGWGFTLVGRGLHDFMDRIRDPVAWQAKNMKKKIHLMLVVSPHVFPRVSFLADAPYKNHEGNKGAITVTRFNGRYCTLLKGKMLWRDSTWASQIPGDWAEPHALSWDHWHAPHHYQIRDILEEHAYQNRLLFAHDSWANNRQTMYKCDTQEYIALEWIRPFCSQDRRSNPDQLLHSTPATSFHDMEIEREGYGDRPYNFYPFVHHRRTEEDMDVVLDGRGDSLEYLNLHEDTWEIRRAPLRPVYPPLNEWGEPEPDLETPGPDKHQVVIDLTYVVKEGLVDVVRPRYGDGKQQVWPKRGFTAEGHPYKGPTFRANLQIFSCCEGCTYHRHHVHGWTSNCCTCDSRVHYNNPLPPVKPYSRKQLRILTRLEKWDKANGGYAATLNTPCSSRDIETTFEPGTAPLHPDLPYERKPWGLRLKWGPMPAGWTATLGREGKLVFVDAEGNRTFKDPRIATPLSEYRDKYSISPRQDS